VYKTPQEIAIMVANLSNKPAVADFELDSHRHGIAAATFSTISSSRPNDSGNAEKAKDVLKGTRHLRPYEVMAVVFQRAPQPKGT
jgi:hypothetical protein